jgi:PAS domain S-box-containing protein
MSERLHAQSTPPVPGPDPHSEHLPEPLRWQLDGTRQRVSGLHRDAATRDPEAVSRLVQEMLEELQAALEALQTSEDTMREQYEALAASRERVEVERERYRSLFELAPDPYLVTDSGGVIRESNRAACRMLGFDADSLTGTPLIERVTREEHRRFRTLLSSARRRGRVDNVALHLVPREGPALPVSASVATQQPREGRLLWLIRDISERREAQKNVLRLVQERTAREEAEAAGQRITNILESISDAFLALDSDARITYMNRRAEQLLDRSREELLGGSLWEHFPELRGTTFEQKYRDAVTRGEPVSLEEFYAPGRTWIELHAFPTAEGLTVYFRNITPRKRAEQAQRFLGRISDELAGSIDFRETVQCVAKLAVPQMGDMCVVYVVGEQGEVRRAAATHVNPHKQALLDHLLQATPIRTGFGDSPVTRALRSGEAELVGGVTDQALESYAADPEHLRTLQQLAPRSLIAVPLISRGRTLGVITLACSESARRYKEEDLAMARELARRAALALDNARLYAEAQQASRARHDLLHVVSHDLRNSLNALLLNLDVLLAETPEHERRTRSRPQLESIQRSAHQMERLVRDLLDVENLETGHFAVHPGVVDAAELVGETIELLQPVAAEKDLTLESDAASDLPLMRADPTRLQQVLVNLVSNAIKFTPPGGRVVVSVRLDPAEEGMVRLAVTDTGIGIREEDIPHVFDRYWQGDHSRASGRGAGLGLAIARGIVEAHGGRIWIRSGESRGSTFLFTLPAVR